MDDYDPDEAIVAHSRAKRWGAAMRVAGIVDSDQHRDELHYISFLVAVGRRVHDIVAAHGPDGKARGKRRRPPRLAWSGLTVYAQRVTEEPS